MREIKFRAWDKEENEMLYNVEHTYDYMNDVKEFSFGHVLDEKERYEIMQFVGLKDCDDVEIYEEDILENEDREKYIIKYNKYKFYSEDFYNPSQDIADDIFSEYAYSFMKVIGNTHQNPELLEIK